MADEEARIVRVDVGDAVALRRLCDSVDVVVNCVGPYSTLGSPVVEAALEARTHLVDLSGEQPWLHHAGLHFHERARRAGVRLVLGVGVEVGLADIAAATLTDEAGRRPWRVRSTIAVRGLTPSLGSRRSVLAVATAATFGWERGALVPARPGLRWRRCLIPDLPGDHWVVSMPGGEIVTGGWHLGAETIESWIAAPILAAPLVGALSALMPKLAGSAAHAAFERVARLGSRTARPESSSFHLMVEVDAAAVSATGTDVYALSGRMAAQLAVTLGGDGDLPTGVLAPGQVATLEDVRRWLPSMRVERVR